MTAWLKTTTSHQYLTKTDQNDGPPLPGHAAKSTQRSNPAREEFEYRRSVGIVRCFKTTIPIRVPSGESMNRLTVRALVFLLAVVLLANPAAAAAYTYMSAEPIPNNVIVGDANLAKIL